MMRTLYCVVLSKEVASTIFKVFSMTRHGIEPRSPGLLANTRWQTSGLKLGLIFWLEPDDLFLSGNHRDYHYYYYTVWLIGLVGRVFTNGPGDQGSIPYQRLKKWYLILPCFTLSIIMYVSRIKWRNPREGVAPSPTLLCSSCRKGSLRSAT